MKKIYKIATHLLLAFALTQAAAAQANNSEESAGISAAMEIYFKALPLEVNSPKKIELLDEAASILNKVIEDNPKSLEAHRKLMGVYLLKQDYSNGIRIMQNAITLSPEDPKLFISLAFLYEHSGALQYAKGILQRALELDPNQKVAKEYMTVIEHKIEALEMDQLHDGKKVVNPGHGKAPLTSPHKK